MTCFFYNSFFYNMNFTFYLYLLNPIRIGHKITADYLHGFYYFCYILYLFKNKKKISNIISLFLNFYNICFGITFFTPLLLTFSVTNNNFIFFLTFCWCKISLETCTHTHTRLTLTISMKIRIPYFIFVHKSFVFWDFLVLSIFNWSVQRLCTNPTTTNFLQFCVSVFFSSSSFFFLFVCFTTSNVFRIPSASVENASFTRCRLSYNYGPSFLVFSILAVRLLFAWVVVVVVVAFVVDWIIFSRRFWEPHTLFAVSTEKTLLHSLTQTKTMSKCWEDPKRGSISSIQYGMRMNLFVWYQGWKW